MASSVQSVDSVSDFGEGKEGQAKRWKAELDSAKRAEENFVKRAEKTIKRYRDERDAVDQQDRKFNILWSNVETLKPAVYSKPPVPEVSRRFDTSSQVNRVAALILERNLHYTVCEHSLFDSTLKQCVEDRLLPGRGIGWVRYVADLKPMYANRPSPLSSIASGLPGPEGGAVAATTGWPGGAPAVPPPPPGQPGVQPPGAPPANQPMPGPPPPGGPQPVSPPTALPPGVGAPPPTQPPIEQLPPGPLPMAGAAQPTPLTPPQPVELQNKAVTDDSYESQVISGERVCHDYVHWKDFRMSPCRTWEECCWVARRVFMTRESGVKRFGADFEKVPLNYTEAKASVIREAASGNELLGPGKGVLKKAAIWEIWSKDDLKVYWVCEDYPQILDERPDLFQLDDFFPCPRPLLATTTSDSTIPIPDFCMYQDQAGELDQITNRISLLTQALKVIGVYDKTQDGVQRLLTEGTDNTMIPVDNWAMFAERGGLKGVVDFFPVETVMNVLEKLINARGTVKQDIYEITGIADIVRGASVASETATAQTIKERFANIRISELQKEVARFASDLVNMTAQLMTNFFQPETLIVNADLADPTGPDFQYVPAAVQLIKDGKLIQHKITVTVDAITEEDDKQEKEARSEFMAQFSNFLQQSAVAIEKMPTIGPMLGHVMLWGVRGFKIGRDIEGEIERSIQQMAAAPPPPTPPDPTQQKLQQAQAEHQQSLQHEQEKLGVKQQENAEDLRYTNAKHEEELNFLRQKNALTLEGISLLTTTKVDAAAQQATQQLDAAGSAHLQGLAHTAEQHAQVLDHTAQQHAAGLIQGQVQQNQDAQQSQEAHQMSLAQQQEAAAAKAKGDPNA